MRSVPMDDKETAELVQALLHELNRPERHLATVVRDFEECGIDYAIVGSLAVRCHNYLRAGNDIDVLVSREGFPKIAQFFIGHGYSYRPGSTQHLYCEFLGGKVPVDIYVEGERRDDGIPLPDPRGSRIKALGRWYASLPLLITLKMRADDLRDVYQMIEANELGADFAERLEPDVKDKCLAMLKHSEPPR